MNWLLFILVWLAVSLAAWSTWVTGELREERAAHADTKLHFRRLAVAEWAQQVARMGQKVYRDPYCPKDVVYCLSPDTFRGPTDPEAA